MSTVLTPTLAVSTISTPIGPLTILVADDTGNTVWRVSAASRSSQAP